MFRKVEDEEYKDYDPEIIAWNREGTNSLEDPLIYSFPEPGDNIKKKKAFAVKDYEKVLFYNKGNLIDVVEGGLYELDKKARLKGTEIVWIYNSMIEIPWGIPLRNGIPTKEDLMVGLHGDLKLSIKDAQTFHKNVIGGRNNYKVQDLKDWIMTLLLTSLRDIFKKYSVKNIILEERERVINLVKQKIVGEFSKYGIHLETFNIIGIQAEESIQKILDHQKDIMISLAESSKDSFDILMKKKSKIEERKSELEENLKQLQDDLLNDKIKKQEFDTKKSIINDFLAEEDKKLQEVNDRLEKMTK